MTRVGGRLSSFLVRAVRSKFFAVFAFALILRAVPEFLSGVYPVGFDALAGYVPSVLALPDNTPMKLFGWVYSPLAIYLLWFIRVVTGVDPYLLLKIMGPVFYGLFNASFYYMLSRGLGWSTKKSFVVSLLFLLLPAVMRTGWDQLREELGLMFLFVLLGVTKLDLVEGAKAKPFLVLALSVLIVFSHQLAAILFFVVAIFQLVSVLIKRQKKFWLALAVVLPSAFFFVWQLYSQFVNPAYNNHFVPLSLPSGTGNFVFTNYFLSEARFLGGDYWKILSNVGSLSLYVFVPLVPFAVKGFFRDKVFAPMLVWLCVTSFSLVVYPWYAFSQHWWWTLLLPIPLTVYTGNYLDKLHVFDSGRLNKRKKTFYMVLFLLGLIAFGYATSTIKIGYPNAYTYIPSGMVASSMPFEDIKDVLTALEWVNANVPWNSTVIVEEKMQGLAYNELRLDTLIRVSPSPLRLNDAVAIADLTQGENYAVWYDSNVDYGAFSGLKVAQFGKVTVFKI